MLNTLQSAQPMARNSQKFLIFTYQPTCCPEAFTFDQKGSTFSPSLFSVCSTFLMTQFAYKILRLKNIEGLVKKETEKHYAQSKIQNKTRNCLVN